MATWRVNNATALGGEVLSFWQAGHVYTAGARCVATTGKSAAAQSVVYECTTGGTSHATTEPTWDTTVGNTTADGTAVWTTRSPTDGTWDNATIFRYAFHNAAAGDTIYVHDAHSELYGANFAITASDTLATRIKIYCVDKTDDSLSYGAVVGTSSGYCYFNGSFYSYGVQYCSANTIGFGVSVSLTHVTLHGPGKGVFTLIKIGTASDYTYLYSGGSFGAGCRLEIFDGDIELSRLNCYLSSGADILWRNGNLVAPNELQHLFQNAGYGGFTGENLDLSAFCPGATTRYLIFFSPGYLSNLYLTRCKLPSGSGFLFWYAASSNIPGNPNKDFFAICDHCTDDNNMVTLARRSYYGEVFTETTIVKTDGATDGTTSYALKMIANAFTDENEYGAALPCVAIHGILADADSQTITIDCIIDSATNLQNDEVWMEVDFPANNTDGLGTVVHTRCAVFGTPADVTASTATWTTTGMSNPNEFKLAATIDPGKVGPYTIKIFLGKPSTTIYVDPLPIVT
jgi:hypothetical protein